MKPSAMLFNLGVLLGAFVAYDLLRGGNEPTSPSAPVAEPAGARGAAAAPVILDGPADEILAERNARRIEALERLLAAGAPAGGSGASPGASPVASMPALDPTDIVNARNPVFHEDTLHTLHAYLLEINRRKVETRQRNRYIGTLVALKLESSVQKREALVEESLKFQQRARELGNRAWSPDEAGRDARRAALHDLEREYVAVVRGLVPAADAKKILDSRIPRGMGFKTGTRPLGEREDR